MATISEKVKGVTGFGDMNPAATHLNEGIKEVISNVLKFNPTAGLIFAKESDEQTENGYKVGSGTVYSVVREDGTDEQWREARLIDISKQYLVTDTDSMFYASKYNPVYIRDNNEINVFPVPGESNESYKVYEIDYPTEDGNGIDLSPSTDLDNVGIANFPEAFYPHLIMYLAIRGLVAKQNSIIEDKEDIELARSLDSTIQNLKEEYVNMFISKDVISPQQQTEGRRGRR
tara:strand:+ start:60 stop:752 length:693 start_codon:yes stop_codon:yes gene_type:complete